MARAASVGLQVILYATSGLIYTPPDSSHAAATFGGDNVARFSFEIETPESNSTAGTIYADELIYSAPCELKGEPKQTTMKIN